jgi:hypothetical protein
MEIHLSEKFSQIEVINGENGLITIQCALWPSWSQLHEATRDRLTPAQKDQLQALFTSEKLTREFETDNEILKIRSAQSLSI